MPLSHFTCTDGATPTATISDQILSAELGTESRRLSERAPAEANAEARPVPA